MSSILDGTKVRDQILSELKPRIEVLARAGHTPGLAVVLVGDDPASAVYVRAKVKACADLGILSEKITPPDTMTTEELLAIVEDLNRRPEINGILIQMPLPPQVDSRRVLDAVAADKDADGFHPLNVGNLVVGRPGPRACTPAGIIELLKRYQIPISGRRAVVIGRSDIVGKPMALLLLQENATVTICHSKTVNLAEEARRADILIAAIGRAGVVTEDFIREGAVVIDVGMNRIGDRQEAVRILRNSPEKLAQFERTGTILVGDVEPFAMVSRSSAYTPVPGGVGPLTIAMLMTNTVSLAERKAR